MKELEVELEQLRLLVVAVVGREQVDCASGSGGGSVDDKVGEDDEGDARESSPQPGRRLRGGKVTGRRETGRRETEHKETQRRETGRKETRRKEMGGKTNGSKERGVGETVENIVGSGKSGSVLVHIGTNNVEREGTTAIVRKYRNLIITLKQTRVEQVYTVRDFTSNRKEGS